MASSETSLFAANDSDKKSEKAPNALRTISEAAEMLDVPQHVLRFWETKFSQIKPLKRNGGRRFYRPQDLEVLQQIKHLLYAQGYTIKGAKKAVDDFLSARADGNVTHADWISQIPPASVNDNQATQTAAPSQTDVLAEIAAALQEPEVDLFAAPKAAPVSAVAPMDKATLRQLRDELVSLRNALQLRTLQGNVAV